MSTAERRGTTALSHTRHDTRREHARTPSPMRTRPHAPARARPRPGAYAPERAPRCRAHAERGRSASRGLGDGATLGDALTGGWMESPALPLRQAGALLPPGRSSHRRNRCPKSRSGCGRVPARMWPSPGTGVAESRRGCGRVPVRATMARCRSFSVGLVGVSAHTSATGSARSHCST
jgi:hypothetical protein